MGRANDRDVGRAGRNPTGPALLPPGPVREPAAPTGGVLVAAGLLGLLAVVETLVRGAGTARGAGTHPTFPLVLLLCLLALAGTLPLALPRPGVAAVAVTAASLPALAPLHALTVAGGCAQVLVLYRLGRRGSPLPAAALALPYLPLALAGPADTETRTLAVLLASLAPMAAWAGAARAARVEAEQNNAAREAVLGSLLEHTARGERARIARELHDIVAHHISMIAVQAETARLTTPGMPAAGAQRLSAIADTARDALTEMRRLLGVLREDAGPGAGPASSGRQAPAGQPGPAPAYAPAPGSGRAAADRQPQPGLDQLYELLDEARDASGTGTRLIVRGVPDPLDPGVELAAFRIVQEALTNARRHAPGAAVDVELHYTGRALRLRVRDNGPGPAAVPPVGGHGLLGMRERAAAVGGELRTGPAPGGGFLVETVLPAKSEVPA